jgi:hypothetical protein
MTETKPGKGKPGRPRKGEAAEFDFSALTFADTTMPKKETFNPFTAPLTASYEYDQPKETTVPADQLRRAEGLIRRAAGDLDIGVSIVADEPGEDGNVRVVFRGKERRARKSKSQDTTPADGPEPSAEDTADDREPAAVGTSAA